PEGREYVLVDAGDKNSKPLFDHQTLAGKLGQATGEQVEALKLQLERLRVNDELNQLSFGFKGKNWVYYLEQDSLQGETASMERPGRTGSRTHWMVTDEERDRGAVNSPDNKYQAYIKDHNVYVRELPGGKEIALSIDGCVGNYYSSYIQWSPDSRMLATTKIRPVEKRYIHMVESSPSDQLQPKLRTLEYTKPGDELRFRVPCIFKVETQEALIPSTELFNNQYQLSGLRWNKDNSGITFEYNERAHKVYRVLEMSAQNGLVRSLIEETAETFVNYSRRFRHDLKNDEEIIWMSERDNWNHLYLYDRKNASVKNQITRGEWYVRDIIRVDEDARRIYFTANGVPKKGDPYLVRYYYINMDGSGLTCLTPDEGHHRATFSRDMKYLVDVYSRVDLAPVAQLRDAESGKLIMPLEKADISELEKTGWKAPEVFVAKGRDGKTDIWGIIIRPSNFDPNKKYPIIEYIYSGPGSHYVPKSFAPYYSDMTNLAELGFIVVKMDGMGTSFRSKAFEEICYQNLKDAGFPDRIL
ncbi:MAG TPA: DPP IV N-terminal domain-containing protein, partial [Bacteroidales bacterium]|nr:DPP IV N-terminal domain-containing protein [Bacteroidales bacterium]